MNINVQHYLDSIFSLSKANPDVQHSNSNFYSFFHPKQISVSIYLLLFFFPFNFLGKKGNSRLHESRNCLTNRGTQILQIQKFSSHMLGDQGQVINTQEQIFFRNIVIRRKLKLKPSPFGIGTVGHQPTLLSFNNESSTSNYFPNSPPNWEINSTIAWSSFCAISNMNLSTGIFQEKMGDREVKSKC